MGNLLLYSYFLTNNINDFHYFDSYCRWIFGGIYDDDYICWIEIVE